LAGGDPRPQFGDPSACTGWKPKEGKRKHLRNSIKNGISQRKNIYKEYKFLDWFLGKI
jgi:hypothetical protein